MSLYVGVYVGALIVPAKDKERSKKKKGEERMSNTVAQQ